MVEGGMLAGKRAVLRQVAGGHKGSRSGSMKRYPSRRSTLAILLWIQPSAAGCGPPYRRQQNRLMPRAVMRALRMATENSEVSRLSMPRRRQHTSRAGKVHIRG